MSTLTQQTLRLFAEEIIVYSNKEQEKDREKFMDKSTGLEMEQSEDPKSLLEWFAEKYKEFGANLEFVTNRSQEGAQFVKGFGGIGGLLRYKVDFNNLTSVDEEEDEFGPAGRDDSGSPEQRCTDATASSSQATSSSCAAVDASEQDQSELDDEWEDEDEDLSRPSGMSGL